jgi:alpha-mannosidase
MSGYNDVIATCIGHTHIDVAWWWTVEQTREKVARSFATVLKLMEEYPGYKFMSSQPQLYAFLKERYPELYARIKYQTVLCQSSIIHAFSVNMHVTIS